MHLNVEIKARCADTASVRNHLLANNASFKGTDHQTDTYFNVAEGRLKLRQGNIENNLIYYKREDRSGPKTSEVNLMPVADGKVMYEILAKSLGIKTEVVKKREIYFIGNVKFHIDEVKDLGSFVEIEAIDKDGTLGHDLISGQCHAYMNALKILPEDLLTQSYSDMLLMK